MGIGSLFLSTLIIVLGTSADIKQYSWDLFREMKPTKYVAIVDRQAQTKYVRFTRPPFKAPYSMYNALWAARANRREKVIRRLPSVVVVLGRENVPAYNPKLGCVHGDTVVCDPKDLLTCFRNIREAACSF